MLHLRYNKLSCSSHKLPVYLQIHSTPSEEYRQCGKIVLKIRHLCRFGQSPPDSKMVPTQALAITTACHIQKGHTLVSFAHNAHVRKICHQTQNCVPVGTGGDVTRHINHLSSLKIGSLLLKCCSSSYSPTCAMHILCEMLQFFFDAKIFFPQPLQGCVATLIQRPKKRRGANFRAACSASSSAHSFVLVM